MPEKFDIMLELWQLGTAVVYFIVGFILFGVAILVVEKLTPFSIRKEIEDDQNTSLGVIMGCGLIALAILLAASIHG